MPHNNMFVTVSVSQEQTVLILFFIHVFIQPVHPSLSYTGTTLDTGITKVSSTWQEPSSWTLLIRCGEGRHGSINSPESVILIIFIMRIVPYWCLIRVGFYAKHWFKPNNHQQLRIRPFHRWGNWVLWRSNDLPRSSRWSMTESGCKPRFVWLLSYASCLKRRCL